MIRMHDRSIFALLLRRPWWMSAAIGAAIGIAGAALVPETWRVAALLMGAPFFVIAAIAAWRGRGVPGPAEVERVTQAVRAMAWPAFADALERAFVRDGWTVRRAEAASHDFVLERGGRRMLVAARRWKSAHLGLEALRALQGAREAADDGPAGLCIALGTAGAPARRYASAEGIAVWQAAELAQALRGLA